MAGTTGSSPSVYPRARLLTIVLSLAQASLVLAGAAAVGAGTGDYMGARAARHTPVLAVTGIVQASGLILTLLVVTATEWTLDGLQDVLLSTCAGLSIAIGLGSLYKALAIGPINVTAPVSADVGAAFPVCMTFLLGLPLTGQQGAGIALGLIAVVLLASTSTEESHSNSVRGIVLAVTAGLGIGGFTVSLDATSPESDFTPLAIARAIAAILLLTIAARKTPLAAVVQSRPVLLVATGIVDGAAMLAYLTALRFGNLAIVAVIASFYPAVTVFLATFIDRERIRARHVAGFLAASAAIGLIVFEIR